MQRSSDRGSRAGRTLRWALTPAIAALLAGGCGGVPHHESEAQRLADEARARLNQNEGGRLVLRAIQAHGGLERWYRKRTSAYNWEYYNFGADLRFKTHQTIDLNSRRIYHAISILASAHELTPAAGRIAWDGTDAWIWPADLGRIHARFWALTPFYFEFIPFVLADPGCTYEALPAATLDGVAYDMVKVGFAAGIGDSPGDTYTLYVDRTTGRVEAIRYTVTYFGRSDRETLFDYEQFAAVDGLTLATRFYGYRFEGGEKGPESNGAIATDLAFDVPFDETQLTIPAGGRIQAGPEP